MQHIRKLYIFFILVLINLLPLSAQIRGVVTDASTKEPLMYVSVFYQGQEVGTVTNLDGEYSIDTHKDWKELTFSFVGYQTQVVKLKPGQEVLNIELKSDDIMLSEVVIKPKKEKYSKKNNPAVDLMRKIIAHKKYQKLEENDFYSYDKYEKMKVSLNDITPEQLEKGIYKKYKFLLDQVEVSEKTNTLILPVSVEETASQTVYRKDPESKKTIIQGMNSNGISDLFSADEMFGTVLKDIFKNINIYDDEISLLHRRFTSPISNEGINFYKYYIMDTVRVAQDSCYHLTFVPRNSQDYGFTGHLYVLKDSTYAVKKCTMNLPHNTGVNFVSKLDIVQDYIQLPNGNWVLKNDDMMVDLYVLKSLSGVLVERTTKYKNYSFDKIEPHIFRLKGDVIKESDMLSKSDEYWAGVREMPLTKSENAMDLFIKRVQKIPVVKYIVWIAKALIENYVSTAPMGGKSKFDFCPVNTIVGKNFVEGWRVRLSGMTTGYLNPHWFVSGYGAYGFGDKRWKYEAQVAYSFNKREYVLWEFPKHYISVSHFYDVMSPMDKFLDTDKDNMFIAFKATTVDQMSYIRDTKINYELETKSGWGIKASLLHRNDEPAGNLKYWNNHVPVTNSDPAKSETMLTKQPFPNTKPLHDITTAEANVTFRYAPGEAFVNSKQRRVPVSLDAPIFTLSHTVGVKGILGSDYNFNRTEASFWKRVWLPASWGKLDISLKGGIEWNTVPFPMLILPDANMSYITQRESFSLINNMEFLNDRYASLVLSYDMNGKLFNRIPFIKKLKWREMFRLKVLWGTLTDKNNPFKSNNPDLFLFPMRNGQYTSHVMDPKMPYIEASVGIYNIFKLLHIEYVHRLTYRDNPDINKWGIRFMIQVVF